MVINFTVCDLQYTNEDGFKIETKDYSGIRCAEHYAVEDGPIFRMGIYARMREDGFTVVCAESDMPEKDIVVSTLRKGIELLQSKRTWERDYTQTALEILTEKYLEVLGE